MADFDADLYDDNYYDQTLDNNYDVDLYIEIPQQSSVNFNDNIQKPGD